MKIYWANLCLFCLIAWASGCAGAHPSSANEFVHYPVDVNTPGIRLPASLVVQGQVRSIGEVTVELPAGVYKPVAQTNSGVYYQAPHGVTVTGSLDPIGGIFLPRSSNNTPMAWINVYVPKEDVRRELERRDRELARDLIASSNSTSFAVGLGINSAQSGSSYNVVFPHFKIRRHFDFDNAIGDFNELHSQ